MPRRGETIRVETWPMPTTRVAYPRSVVAYDSEGNECFRTVSLWVLMDLDNRNMILPGRSGITVDGTLRGTELVSPTSLPPKALTQSRCRTVSFTDLDRNGHMNNTRYLDWLDDLLPSRFHQEHTPKELLICYLNESREGQTLELCWDLLEDGALQVDALRQTDAKTERVFSARVFY
jgi:medium-chain acyl-[acyl-carrier-protein] hydrolase